MPSPMMILISLSLVALVNVQLRILASLRLAAVLLLLCQVLLLVLLLAQKA